MPYKNKASCHQLRRYEGLRKTVMHDRRPDQLKKHAPQIEQRQQPSLPKVPLECRVRSENQLSRQSFQVLLRSPIQVSRQPIDTATVRECSAQCCLEETTKAFLRGSVEGKMKKVCVSHSSVRPATKTSHPCRKAYPGLEMAQGFGQGVNLAAMAANQFGNPQTLILKIASTGLKLQKVVVQDVGPVLLCNVSTGRRHSVVPGTWWIFKIVHSPQGLKASVNSVGSKVTWPSVSVGPGSSSHWGHQM